MSAIPTNNPGRCSHCNKAYHTNGKRLEICWSIRVQAWLCLSCHFEAPDAENNE